MNVVTLIGRLTRDVEIRYTQNGNARGRFSLAVNRRVPNQNGERQADFINCVIWNKPAEVLAQYAKKGSQIGVQGRIETGSYEKDGQRIYTTDVIVENFDFLDTRNANGGQQPASTNSYSNNYSNNNPSYSAPQSSAPTSGASDFEVYDNISDDDLPF